MGTARSAFATSTDRSWRPFLWERNHHWSQARVLIYVKFEDEYMGSVATPGGKYWNVFSQHCPMALRFRYRERSAIRYVLCGGSWTLFCIAHLYELTIRRPLWTTYDPPTTKYHFNSAKYEPSMFIERCNDKQLAQRGWALNFDHFEPFSFKSSLCEGMSNPAR